MRGSLTRLMARRQGKHVESPLSEKARLQTPAYSQGRQADPVVQRKLLNADELIQWAKAHGFETTQPAEELHTTVAYSKIPFDWSNLKPDTESPAAREAVPEPNE